MRELWRSFNSGMDKELRDTRAWLSQWMIRSVERFANNTILVNWCILLLVIGIWALIVMTIWGWLWQN